ncbi:MAG: (d)CMP kinase [Clostridia bacterium]|nr:(d)CMP kinase [Clostridia bacterium]
MNLVNVDTGAMYRCVALKALRNEIGITEVQKLEEMLEEIVIEIKREGDNQIIFLDGENVSTQIRTSEVDNCVAKFAALACVRNKVTPLQRKIGETQNVIMEGRDIGTTVFPNADVKIYLDASMEARAKRRYKQNQEKGIEISYEDVLENIKQRHKLETEREISPLVQAKDAIYIDSSNMTIEQVVDKVIEIIEQKRK